MRKIAKEREHVEGKYKKRDIIEEYADFGSKVYAPLTRDGHRDPSYILEDVKPQSLETQTGIDDISKKVKLRTSIETKLNSKPKTSEQKMVKIRCYY